MFFFVTVLFSVVVRSQRLDYKKTSKNCHKLSWQSIYVFSQKWVNTEPLNKQWLTHKVMRLWLK